ALNKAQASALGRLRYFIGDRTARPGASTKAGARQIVKEAMLAAIGRDNPHGVLARRQRAERAALASNLREQSRSEIRAVQQIYQRELARLKQTQLRERRTLQQEHSRESQALAREIKEGRDRKQYRRETGQAISEEFARR